MSRQVREALTKRANEFHIKLDDVSIVRCPWSVHTYCCRLIFPLAQNLLVPLNINKSVHHIRFTSPYCSAQQEAERSKYLVLKAEQEKRAAIIRAEGEAEAAKLIEEASKAGPGFIELRKIEAKREIADTLSRSRNITYVPKGMAPYCCSHCIQALI